VSYDLRSVSKALANFRPLPDDPYVPDAEFERPFSSRLAVDICRDLAEGHFDVALVREDVEQRLIATLRLVEWLENVNASAQESDRFLRLRKQPFRLFEEAPPLGATALEVLRVQAVLENRIAELGTLNDLAHTVETRRVRRKAVVGLQALGATESGSKHILLFRLPADTFGSEFQAGLPGLIVSDGHPDRVLDMTSWRDMSVKLLRSREPDKVALLMNTTAFESRVFQDLWKRKDAIHWVLDRTHFDVTTERLELFLRFLDQEAAP
jgi:hypothetical protein